MKLPLLYFSIAITLTCFLLAPGVWWGDSLNAYIQSVSGIYGAAQPVFMALFLKCTRFFLPGSLLPFLIFVTLYFAGFALLIFYLIKNKYLAPVLFFSFSFCPLLFANIGVIQTESFQLALLSAFIALTVLFYRYEGVHRKKYFAGLVVLLGLFSLVRYDTLHISLLLSYWLGYTWVKKHNRKVIFITAGLFFIFKISATFLDSLVNIPQELKPEMRNSLLVADIAAISAQSKTNYIPDYCWQPVIPNKERTVEKIIYGQNNWSNSFYSYIYNIDPSIGLFTYSTSSHTEELFMTWFKVVAKHPFLFFKYHLTVFSYLVFNDNFNMGIWSGLKDSHVNHSRLLIEKNEAVDSFLVKHSNRFAYRNGNLFFDKDDTPITPKEENALLQLAGNRRAADVVWMKWYSYIPAKTYNTANSIAEKYVNPSFELFKWYFRGLCMLAPYFLALVIFLFYAPWLKRGYYRFTYILLCCCGIVHLLLRLLILTDPVYRFGMLTILFAFFAFVILVADKLNKQTA